MNTLADILTYIRRIIKTPSNAVITDNLLIDYVNRFWLMDMSARMQLFDLKTTYEFQTIPGVCNYNMPLYNIQTQPGPQAISYYPMFQGFEMPCFVNGIQVPFYNSLDSFYNLWPQYLTSLTPVAVGDGVTTTFQFQLPLFPSIPGYLDMTGVIDYAQTSSSYQDPIFDNSFPLNSNGNIAIRSTSFYPGLYITYTNTNGSNTVISDSGIYLKSSTNSELYGLLMQPGTPPFGNLPLASNVYSTTQNTVNYNTGVVNVTFPHAPPTQAQIQAQCYFFQQGLPRAIDYYNNCISLRNPPNTQYLIKLTGYLTPAAFLTTSQAVQFAYMSEYIARGAARKILSDTGDIEQFNFYEPLFKEQELLVWKRSQRIITSTRTATIFSENQGPYNTNAVGQGTA